MAAFMYAYPPGPSIAAWRERPELARADPACRAWLGGEEPREAQAGRDLPARCARLAGRMRRIARLDAARPGAGRAATHLYNPS
jgi:hypothetical protein